MTREEAKAWLEHHFDPIQDGTKQSEAVSLAIKALEQEPKTGHWIVQPSNKEQGERDFIWWKCSECGQVIYSETEKDRKEFHAFCSRCGADMREVEE